MMGFKDEGKFFIFIVGIDLAFISLFVFIAYGVLHDDVTCIDDCDYHWKKTVCQNTDIQTSIKSFYYTYEDCYEISSCDGLKCSETQGKEFPENTDCCKDDFTICSLEFVGNYRTTYWTACKYDKYKRHFREEFSTEETVIPEEVKGWFSTKYKEEFWEHLRHDDPLQSRRDYYNHLLLVAVIILVVGTVMCLFMGCFCREGVERGHAIYKERRERRLARQPLNEEEKIEDIERRIAREQIDIHEEERRKRVAEYEKRIDIETPQDPSAPPIEGESTEMIDGPQIEGQ